MRMCLCGAAVKADGIYIRVPDRCKASKFTGGLSRGVDEKGPEGDKLSRACDKKFHSEAETATSVQKRAGVHVNSMKTMLLATYSGYFTSVASEMSRCS